MGYKKKTKKIKRQIDSAIVNVKSSFNNTVVSVTTTGGDVLLRSSAGALGQKGSRKGTPFAASQATSNLAMAMIALGIRTVQVNLQGAGNGRDAAVKALQTSGIQISSLSDVTPLPHNGCRAPKKRRV